MTLQELTDQLARLVADGYGDREVIAGDDFQKVAEVRGPDDRNSGAASGGLMRTVWLELGGEIEIPGLHAGGECADAPDDPLGLCEWCDFGRCDPPKGVPCDGVDCACECGSRVETAAREKVAEEIAAMLESVAVAPPPAYSGRIQPPPLTPETNHYVVSTLRLAAEIARSFAAGSSPDTTPEAKP